MPVMFTERGLLLLSQILFSCTVLTATVEPSNLPTGRQANISALCECNKQLLPEVKSTNDLLGFLLVVVEEAQSNAAINVVKKTEVRVAESSAVQEPVIGSSEFPSIGYPESPQLGGPLFLKDMDHILTSIAEIQNNMTITGASEVVGGVPRSVEHLSMEHCLHDDMVQAYTNLSSLFTDAVHYRENVRANEKLASETLIEVRKTVVSIKDKMAVFETLMKELKSVPCPTDEASRGRSADGTHYIEVQTVDCPCMEKLLPEVKNLTEVMDWVLQIMKETQARAAWTVKAESLRNPPGRAAVAKASDKTSDRYSFSGEFTRGFLEGNFYSGFHSNPVEPLLSVRSSSFKPLQVECPLNKIHEYRLVIMSKLTDALHYREYVNDDPDFANYLLGLLNESIGNMEKKLKEYKQFIRELEVSDCYIQANQF